MQEMLLELVQTYGYGGIGLLLFAETVFPPIPSEAVLLFAGYLTRRAGLHLGWVVLSATAGSVLGALLLYALGRALGMPRLERIAAGKWGRMLHFGPEQLHKADALFAKRAFLSVFLCRCIPLLRSVVSIPAGVTAMAFWPFLGLTAAGSYLWNTALVWLGRQAGNAWQGRATLVGKGGLLLLCGLCLGAFFWFWAQKRRKRSNPRA